MKFFLILMLAVVGLKTTRLAGQIMPTHAVPSTPLVLEGEHSHELSHVFYYAVDPSGKRTVNDVIDKDYPGEFIPATPENLVFGYTKSSYWLSFSLKNAAAAKVWYLAADFPAVEISCFRLVKGGKPVEQAAANGRIPACRIEVETGAEAGFLVRVSSPSIMNLQFKILTESLLNQRLYQETIFICMIVGCFLTIILYNVFLYFSLRDKNYLYYIAFVVVNSHVSLLAINFPIGVWDWLGFDWRNALNFYRPLAPMTIFLFVRSFLQIQSNHPRLDRFFLGYMLGLILLMGASFFAPQAELRAWSDSYFMAGVIILFYAGFYCLMKGYTPARFYLAGLSAFLLGVFLYLLQMKGGLPSNSLTLNVLVVGQAMEMILMSLALGSRFNLLREAKVRAEVTVQVKSHLLRIISHDIANPLMIVKGRALQLEKELAQEKRIASILLAVDMIEEIMRFVQTTEAVNRGMSIPLKPVFLSEVFARLEFIFNCKATSKGVRLEINLESPDLAVKAEKISLSHEVLGNLLANAIKFSLPGGLVKLNAFRDKGHGVVITLQDQGVGMDGGTVASLFDATRNHSRVGTSGEKGFGYGMPLVKAFLDAYGSTIEVKSTPMKGDPIRGGTVVVIRMADAS